METNCKYYAFISYNSHDQIWGKRLQRKLERYRMPATLCSERGWNRKPINPVFFAPTDIQPGGLTEELQERLRLSRNLIVICSPHSAQSEWVGKEIEFFHSLGRTKNIHFFIIDGQPHSKDPQTECFNPILEQLNLPEILGANINEHIYRWPWLNRERAYVQLISKLLDIEFDAIWKRHRRIFIQEAVACSLGFMAVTTILMATWKYNQPFDMNIQLKETSQSNINLPQIRDAVVTINLDNENKTDTVPNVETPITFTNIPHRFLNKPVKIKVNCPNFIEVDTTLQLDKSLTIKLRRDPNIYGMFRFRLWDPEQEKTFPRAEIMVEEHKVIADSSGYFYVYIPIDHQKEWYRIIGTNPKVDDSIKVPCGPDAVILIKRDHKN